MQLNSIKVRAAKPEVPGGEYLCQVNETTSCGACCGVYNLADTSKASMTAMLIRRSDLFSKTPRNIAAIDGFAADIAKIESQERPFDDFHHCPFIGMIGHPNCRVGCLLHPLGLGNSGVDYRGMSYYGGMACRTYFCPTHYELSSEYKCILRLAVTDWHLYGLVITERSLVQALFHHIENRLQDVLTPQHFQYSPTATQCLVDLLAIKRSWPYRPSRFNTDCHYFFTDNPTPRPAVNYTQLGLHPSVWDEVLVELNSEFKSADDLLRAERMIENRVQAVVRSLSCS